MRKLIIGLAATLVAATGMAADTAWTGATDNDWATAGNWSNSVPGVADTAYIHTGMPAITAPAGTINVLDLGSNLGNSTLNISSDFTVNDDVFMGTGSTVSDTATINQTAGTVVLGSVGEGRFGNTGTGANVYNLSGGSLTTASSWDRFGAASSFTFNQTGGTFTDTGSGFILADAGGSATVNIGSSAIFNANAIDETRIGHQGIAVLTVDGSGEFHSSTSTTGDSDDGVILGRFTAGDGTVYVKDTAIFQVDNTLIVGMSGSGTLNQSGGTVSADDMYLGRYSTGDGTVNLSGGSMSVTDDLFLGDVNDGEFNQSGGTLTVGDALYVADAGNATFNQTGGDVQLGRIRIADDDGSTGLYSISGGTLNVDGSIYAPGGSRGEFEVVGSAATSITLDAVAFYQDTFRVKLDAGGATLVEVNGAVELRQGVLEVDTLAGFNGTIDDTYDIMWADGGFTMGTGVEEVTFNNLSGDAEFEWNIVSDGGTGEFLRLTVIPEPATLGLVASLGGAMLWIRRKFMI